MAGKIRGFSREATKYVQEHPGRTAQDIVSDLLRSGRARSAAENQIGSLVATLHKHCTQIGLVRAYENGRYRFYPGKGISSNSRAGIAPEAGRGRPTANSGSEGLSTELDKSLKALVASGRYPTWRSAEVALMEKGREAPEIQQLVSAFDLLAEAAGKV